MPALSSTSAFVRMTPSMSIASLNILACSVASFPVMLSPTKSFRSGDPTRMIFSISFMRFALVYILPAVSARTTWIWFFLAYSFASKTTAAGSEPYWCFIIGTFSFLAWVSSCSIDAARKVSAAAKTQDMFCFLRCSASFAKEVVFPAPLMPNAIIV